MGLVYVIQFKDSYEKYKRFLEEKGKKVSKSKHRGSKEGTTIKKRKKNIRGNAAAKEDGPET